VPERGIPRALVSGAANHLCRRPPGVDERLREISAGEPTATAVRQTVEEIQAAVIVAVVAASAVSAATS
jgi:hypothetical protein